jgi:hypothetical protein
MLEPEPYVSRLRTLASHCESGELATELERIAEVLEEQHKKIKSQSTWLWLLGFAALGFASLSSLWSAGSSHGSLGRWACDPKMQHPLRMGGATHASCGWRWHRPRIQHTVRYTELAPDRFKDS